MVDVGTHDNTAPAPGSLELVQRFVNLHEHGPGGVGDLPSVQDFIPISARADPS